jgi:endoglucanase
MKKYPLIILGLLWMVGVTSLFNSANSTAELKAIDPGDVSLCMVAPDVIEFTVKSGQVQYGQQIPYIPQNNDQIIPAGIQRLAYRDGQYLGCLAGKEQKILHTPDRLLESGFPVREAEIPRNYRLVSRDDPHYFTEVIPKSVYRKSKPADLGRVEINKFLATSEHKLYIILPYPLTPRASYQILGPKGFPVPLNFRYDPVNMRSEAVHIGQIGFKPTDPVKIAFLSQWMGNGKGLSYNPKLSFQIIDNSTGEPVWQGRIKLSKAASAKTEDAYQRNYNNTNVYEMNFAGLNIPGSYRVYVEGVGCSFPFTIGEAVWENAFITSARGFYHQRSGIELGPPYTRFRRPRPFHPADGMVVYLSDTPLMDTGNGLNTNDTNFGNLVKGVTAKTIANAWGGYMDAGDWDRRIQHLDATRLLCELYLFFPAYFNKIKLNIPESDNDIPDILDEALFNLDCYRRMQTPEGGIRGGIESEEHPRQGEASWQESLKVMAYAPDVWSSYIYAGVAMEAALALSKVNPELAETYSESAFQAMRWAEREFQKGIATQYQNDVRDARNLAAAEMYRFTGDQEWNKIFLATTVFTKSNVALSVWKDHDQRHAAWVYLIAGRLGINRPVAAYCREALLKEADERVTACGKSGFHWAKFEWNPPGWGAFSAPDALSLVRAHRLTGNPKYLNAIILACQTGAGANPLNMCYTTGVGSRWPEHVLNVDARISGQQTPPGLTVFGPMDYKLQQEPSNQWFLQMVQPYIFPAVKDWPAIESYWDVFWFPAMCEYTIQQPMAVNAYVWGYLAGRETFICQPDKKSPSKEI